MQFKIFILTLKLIIIDILQLVQQLGRNAIQNIFNAPQYLIHGVYFFVSSYTVFSIFFVPIILYFKKQTNSKNRIVNVIHSLSFKQLLFTYTMFLLVIIQIYIYNLFCNAPQLLTMRLNKQSVDILKYIADYEFMPINWEQLKKFIPKVPFYTHLLIPVVVIQIYIFLKLLFQENQKPKESKKFVIETTDNNITCEDLSAEYNYVQNEFNKVVNNNKDDQNIGQIIQKCKNNTQLQQNIDKLLAISICEQCRQVESFSEHCDCKNKCYKNYFGYSIVFHKVIDQNNIKHFTQYLIVSLLSLLLIGQPIYSIKGQFQKFLRNEVATFYINFIPMKVIVLISTSYQNLCSYAILGIMILGVLPTLLNYDALLKQFDSQYLDNNFVQKVMIIKEWFYQKFTKSEQQKNSKIQNYYLEQFTKRCPNLYKSLNENKATQFHLICSKDKVGGIFVNQACPPLNSIISDRRGINYYIENKHKIAEKQKTLDKFVNTQKQHLVELNSQFVLFLISNCGKQHTKHIQNKLKLLLKSNID